MDSSNNAANGNAANGDQLTQLGPKIREARQRAGLTLKDLASKVGLTPSHISQIERGITNPSVSAFWGIASALDVSMDYFFESTLPSDGEVRSLPDAHAELHRRHATTGSAPAGRAPGYGDSSERDRESGDFSPVVLPEGREIIKIIGGIEWHRLTPRDEHALEFLELHYPVGTSSGPLAYTHRGREYNRVLQGTVLVELGFSRYTLTVGSAITFDCTIPHRFVNIGEEPYVGICVILDRC